LRDPVLRIEGEIISPVPTRPNSSECEGRSVSAYKRGSWGPSFRTRPSLGLWKSEMKSGAVSGSFWPASGAPFGHTAPLSQKQERPCPHPHPLLPHSHLHPPHLVSPLFFSCSLQTPAPSPSLCLPRAFELILLEVRSMKSRAARASKGARWCRSRRRQY